MPKFSFLSWNVRMYNGSKKRLEDADQLITELDPDVIGLLEFKAKKKARELMFDRFPEYDWSATDSTGNLEVLIGFRRGKFDQVIFSQKRTFNNTERTLRPGALISVKTQGRWYSLLYLHTDSGTKHTDYNNRWKVFSKIWKLEEALKKHSPTKQRSLIVLGDLNTMGKKNPGKLSGAEEIDALQKKASQNGMVLLSKDQPNTWSQWGKGPRQNRRKLKVSELAGTMHSDLDHVLASKNLDFVAHGADGSSAIHVKGWPQLSGKERVDFLWSLSDHSALFGEVW